MGVCHSNLLRYLALLIVDRDHQRQRIGSTLLETRLNALPQEQRAHLETSKAGFSLYEKFGFKPVDNIKLDGWKLEFPIMVRNK